MRWGPKPLLQPERERGLNERERRNLNERERERERGGGGGREREAGVYWERQDGDDISAAVNA